MVGVLGQPERAGRQIRVNVPYRKPWPPGSSAGGGVQAIKFGKEVRQVGAGFPARQSPRALALSDQGSSQSQK